MSTIQSRMRPAPRALRASRPTSRMLANAAALTLAAAVLTACADQPRGITGPRAPSELLAKSPGSTPPNAEAGLVYCDVAMRTPSGRYIVRTNEIKVPDDIFDPNGGTVTFAVRGAPTESMDPTRLTMCQIPNTAAAVEFFKSHFRVAGTDVAYSGLASREAGSPPPVNSLNGSVSNLMLFQETTNICAEYMVSGDDCGCGSEYCDGWDDGGGVEEGPQPPEPDEPEFSYNAAPAPAAATISCFGQTDLPHRSSTVGFNANVHGRTGCSVPLPLTISISLQKQKCLWIFCWWSTMGSGFYANVATVAQTNAAAFCSKGWWRGQSFHGVISPLGYWPPALAFYTYNTNYIYC